MDLLNQKIPAYLYEKSNLVRLVLFTAVFALVFINIYKPFSSEHWYPGVTGFMFFAFSSLVILTGVLVVVISRVIMYYHTKRHTIGYLTYGAWIFAEIFFMALFYTVYGLSLRKGAAIMNTFRESIIHTSLVLLLPYAMLTLYFSWREKEKRLRQMEENKAEKNAIHPVILFHDEKGELRLSIQRSCLLYIESADNYVIIWYLNKNTVTRFILRSTLKALEKELSEAHILRCHRSFLVNFDQVKIIRREKEGIFLDLGIEGIPDIPISKTYSESVSQWFIERAKL
jgi:DNA-binding LytR/AlgR family response regulator